MTRVKYEKKLEFSVFITKSTDRLLRYIITVFENLSKILILQHCERTFYIREFTIQNIFGSKIRTIEKIFEFNVKIQRLHFLVIFQTLCTHFSQAFCYIFVHERARELKYLLVSFGQWLLSKSCKNVTFVSFILSRGEQIRIFYEVCGLFSVSEEDI